MNIATVTTDRITILSLVDDAINAAGCWYSPVSQKLKKLKEKCMESMAF